MRSPRPGGRLSSSGPGRWLAVVVVVVVLVAAAAAAVVCCRPRFSSRLREDPSSSWSPLRSANEYQTIIFLPKKSGSGSRSFFIGETILPLPLRSACNGPWKVTRYFDSSSSSNTIPSLRPRVPGGNLKVRRSHRHFLKRANRTRRGFF